METLDRLALPYDNRKGPNCGVTALAVFTGKPFDLIWDRLVPVVKLRKHPPRKWNGCTYLSELIYIIAALGISAKRVKLTRKVTLETFVRLYAQNDVLYLVRTTKHVQCVLNGYVTDQFGTRFINVYHGRRKFVSDYITKSEA